MPSRSSSSPVIDGLQLGDLIRALDERDMEPFSSERSASLCSDAAISCEPFQVNFLDALADFHSFLFPLSANPAAQFSAKHLTTWFVVKDGKHIFDGIGWRYSRARDAADTIPLKSNSRVRCAKNPVDRAVWP